MPPVTSTSHLSSIVNNLAYNLFDDPPAVDRGAGAGRSGVTAEEEDPTMTETTIAVLGLGEAGSAFASDPLCAYVPAALKPATSPAHAPSL